MICLYQGLGWALVFTPTIASVMQYFNTRRALAMGLGFTGVGLSSFAFSPLFQYLVQEFAWRGALLILGALSLNLVAAGALIRPLRPPKVVEKVRILSKYFILYIYMLNYIYSNYTRLVPCRYNREFTI